MQFNRRSTVLEMIMFYGHTRTIDFAYMTDKELLNYYIKIYKNERYKEQGGSQRDE